MSKPVQPHIKRGGVSQLRGKAQGVLVSSTLPIRASLHAIPKSIELNTRLVESFVTVNSHTVVRALAFYGHPRNEHHKTPLDLSNRILSVATTRGLPLLLGILTVRLRR